jgi:hypothetical protein
MLLVFAASACSCGVTLPVSFSPFEETQVILCKDVNQDNPISLADVFSSSDRQICAFVKARFDESADQLLVPGEEVTFVFTWYYEGETIATKRVNSPVSSDLWVTPSDCIVAEKGTFSQGQYRVVVNHGDIKIEEAKFQIK